MESGQCGCGNHLDLFMSVMSSIAICMDIIIISYRRWVTLCHRPSRNGFVF